jgi:hypothetical protein
MVRIIAAIVIRSTAETGPGIAAHLVKIAVKLMQKTPTIRAR